MKWPTTFKGWLGLGFFVLTLPVWVALLVILIAVDRFILNRGEQYGDSKKR